MSDAPNPTPRSHEAATFSRRFRTLVLPFWAAEGIDPRSGLFWERFGLDGHPIDGVAQRLMVQARQSATFAHASLAGMCSAGEAALRVFDHALAIYSDEGDLSRGLAFAIQGSRQDARRDAYTHAFVLFALAAVLRLAGERRHRAAVEQLVSFVDARLVDVTGGGLRDGWPDPAPGRVQNPTMHLLEAYLALHEAWPERGFLDRARRIVALVEDRLTNHAVGAVLEHYAEDWRPLANMPEGLFFEPGHQFEWAWLIDRYAALAGTASPPICERLWELGCRGFDGAGFCIDAMGLDLTPLRGSRRLWPQCEAARTALTRSGHDGEAVAATAFGRLNAAFLDRPFPAGWIDRLDATGEIAVEFVPASSLYHLYGAWAQLAKRRQRDGDTPLQEDR